MKKKVRIEKAPKRKVRIEGLPKADVGKMQPLATNPEKMQPIGPLYNQSSGLTLSGEKLPVPDFTKNQMEKTNMQKSKTNFRFNMPIFSGNPYFERAGMYLNQGLNRGMDYTRMAKGEKIAPNDLYRGYYSGPVGSPVYDYKTTTRYKEVAEGGYLPIAQFGTDYVSAPNMQTSYNVQNDPALQNSNGANSLFRQRTFQNEQPDFSEPEIKEETNNTYYSAPKSFDQSVNDVIDFQGFEEPEYNKIKKQRKGIKLTDKRLQGLGAVGDFVQTGVNLTKGALDIAGSNIANRRAQQAESQAYSQAVASDAMNVTPYETMGYGFTGRNALAADGMQIRQIGGMGEPNVEVEGKEHIKLPNGFSQEIQGKSHAQGGIPLNLPQGTQIFSEKLKPQVKFLKELMEIDPQYSFLSKAKLPEKGVISYADLAKKFETKKYADLLNSKTADPIQKTTAQMMMSQSLMALEKLFALQEQNKLSGVHGPQVQQNAMEAKQQEQAQEQQQPMEEQPMMRHGGYHLPKAQEANMPFVPSGGLDIKSYSPKTRSGRYTGETDFDIMKRPSWKERNLTEWDQAYAQDYGMPGFNIAELAEDPNVAKKYSSLPGKDPIAGLYQEYMYDYHLDRLDPNQNFSPEEREKSRQALQNMWGEAGSTLYGLGKGLKTKGIDLSKADYKDYANLRGSFVDAYGRYRYLQPNERPAPAEKQSAAPAGKAPEEKAPEVQTKYLQPITENEVSLGLPLYVPNVYNRDPLNYYKIQPEFIDPRYLDIQPQLNQITRGQRAIQSNIGSRGSADIANLLQAQANAASAQQQAFGQKYNYDRAQDAAAQQFNAQAKMNIDQYNQGSWFQQLEDPIRRRESLLDTQKRTDAQAAMENARRMQAFYGNKDFVDKTFYPLKEMTGEDVANTLGKIMLKSLTNPQNASTANITPSGTTTSTGKYGGRVKIKLKTKRKLRK